MYAEQGAEEGYRGTAPLRSRLGKWLQRHEHVSEPREQAVFGLFSTLLEAPEWESIAHTPDPNGTHGGQYKAELKENGRKALLCNYQTKLRRLDDLAMPNCERFPHVAYSSAPPDQNELSEAIKKLIQNNSRAERLRRAGSGKQN